ncbi:MAG: glycolate oxidase binding subunit [Candidatus Eremiobacteraeota bacterium]|nr:glycolate oxidase binding subunit [Candidatus Eremiobacteraeota bacterium]
MTVSIAGVTPRDVVTPRSIPELAEMVRELHGERKPFAFVGGGTHLELGNAPRALDTVIRTTVLDEVVDYTPEDQTITVQAGITLAELDGVLEPHGQMLPLDAADRERATVGGVVATNAYGRRRQRYGTAKDLIIGVGIVRPDGVRARGGGKVIKNVAGFDLPKLMVGSLGTLGAIATVTFRLYPIPQATRAAVLRFEREAPIAAVLRELIARRLEPESVALYNYNALVVTFAGTQAGVDAQMRTLIENIASAYNVEAVELSDLEREAYEQRERAVRRDGPWRLHVVAPPSEHVATAASSIPATPLAVPVAYPALGVSFHAISDAAFAGGTDASPDWHVRDLRAAVTAATHRRGRVVFDAMPPAARGLIDAWGPPPRSLPLMRTLKNNFDPHGLCNPGRFIGGL